MRASVTSRGSTLPEALIALLILSVGMLTAMLLMTRGTALLRADVETRAALRTTANAVELDVLQPRVTAELHDQLLPLTTARPSP